MKFTKKNLELLLQAGATRQELLNIFNITLRKFLVRVHDEWGFRSYRELVELYHQPEPLPKLVKFVILSAESLEQIREVIYRTSMSAHVHGIHGHTCHDGVTIEGVYAAMYDDYSMKIPLVSDNLQITSNTIVSCRGSHPEDQYQLGIYDVETVPQVVIKMFL